MRAVQVAGSLVQVADSIVSGGRLRGADDRIHCVGSPVCVLRVRGRMVQVRGQSLRVGGVNAPHERSGGADGLIQCVGSTGHWCGCAGRAFGSAARRSG